MSEYEHDIFYNVSELDIEQRKAILLDAKDKCDGKWLVDVLDVSKSRSRQQIEMSFEDIMAKFDSSCHFIFIHRRGFKGLHGEYLIEVGFSTMNKGPNYYLWIQLSEDKLPYFIDKYDLKPMK